MTAHALLFGCNPKPGYRNAGVHRIATYLRQHDWSVEVCDFLPFWPEAELKEFVRSRVTADTKFFGFGIFFSSSWKPHLDSFTAWLKETWPDIPTVMGGQSVGHTTAKNIDYWVDSYGENAVLELARSFVNNTSHRITLDPQQFGQRKMIRALHSYPSYPMEDYGIRWLKEDFIQHWEWQTVELSRGCKFSCAYCNYPILGVKGDYSCSADSFEQLLNYNYNEFGTTRYWIADETFNDRIEKITKFADVVERSSIDGLWFSAFIRADLLHAHPEMIDELHRMRLGGHFYGIETFNHATGRAVGKGLHPDRIKQTLLTVKSRLDDIYYRGTVAMVIGLPHETPETVQNSVDWLMANWQGQSINVWPYELEDIDNDAVKNGATNFSKISRDMDRYGIRRMSREREQELLRAKDYFYNWRVIGYTPNANMLLWEHETMNIFQAHDIAFNIQNLQVQHFRMNNWDVNRLDYVQNRTVPFDQIRELAEPTTQEEYTAMMDFVNRYVNFKLNLQRH